MNQFGIINQFARGKKGEQPKQEISSKKFQEKNKAKFICFYKASRRARAKVNKIQSYLMYGDNCGRVVSSPLPYSADHRPHSHSKGEGHTGHENQKTELTLGAVHHLDTDILKYLLRGFSPTSKQSTDFSCRLL